MAVCGQLSACRSEIVCQPVKQKSTQAVNRKSQPVFASAWLRHAALWLALILVVGIDILWLRLDNQATKQGDWVDHTHQVIAKVEETLARSGDMVMGQRGFALTHEDNYLQPYRTATNRMPFLLEQLRDLTADNPGQAARTERLALLLERHQRINQEHIDLLLKTDPNAPDLEFRRTVKDSNDRLRSLAQEIVSEETRLLMERRETLDHDTQMVTLANIASGVVSIALLLGVFRALWRENERRRGAETRLEELVEQRTASLNLSVERFRLAQQAARIGMFEWNLQTGENVWSPELAAMHGLSPGNFPPTKADWEKLIHPDDRAETTARMQQTMETGEPSEGEWRVLWPDGSVHWLFGRFQVFKDEAGRLVALTGVNIDITERKRLERETIEASDREMRRIGHDLHDSVGQQLTALSLLVYSEEKLVQTQAPQRAESFKNIAASLREVVRQIRVLSHGLSPVSLEDNGLPEALRKLAAETRLAAKVDCEFAGPVSSIDIDAEDAVQLYRIGQEAVTNALKHGRAQKISISLETTPARVELKITDNGRGFSPAKPNGAGLGLRAMKYRAGLMGAALQIDSAVGKGTRITCTIHKLN